MPDNGLWLTILIVALGTKGVMVGIGIGVAVGIEVSVGGPVGMAVNVEVGGLRLEDGATGISLVEGAQPATPTISVMSNIEMT